MRRLLLITNDNAGTSDEEAINAAAEVLRDEAEVEVVGTGDLDELTRTLHDHLGTHPETELIVAGGDGSLHAMIVALGRLNRLHREDGSGVEAPVLGLIPLGTGNDFARAIDLPTEPDEAARVILSGPLRPIDVIEDDTGALVVNAVHVGAGDEAGRAAKPWKERFGPIGYIVGSVLAGLQPKGWRLRVVIDGEVVADGQHRLMQVAIANGTSVGGGAQIAPDAAPGDGRADVLVARARGRFEQLRYAVRLQWGGQEGLHGVRSYVGREVRISTTGEPFGINADGEFSDPVRERTWRVLRAAYRLRVPAGQEPGVRS